MMVHDEADTPDSLFRRVDELLNRNDYPAAIQLLSSANRSRRDPAIERRLVELRINGFARSARPQPQNWQFEYSDRFEGITSIPEVAATELDVDALSAGILGNGGLIVRGLMDQPTVQTMRANIDRTLLARRACAQGIEDTDNDRWFERCASVQGGPVQFRKDTKMGPVWCVDSPPTAFQLIEFYRSIGLPAILDSYFGEPAVLSVRKWVLRRVEPNNGGVSGWHQDGQFLGDESIRTVNLWVALTDCGGDADAPGIEIVADNDRQIYQCGSHGAPFDWTVGQGLVDELAESRPVLCPRFNAGDAIFFDHYNLHRTAFGVDHSCNRYAVESWFFADSTAPAKQQPLLF
jgi:hypothetical protein